MSRLRWTTYDDRGRAWRQARARGVAASLALCVLGLGTVTTTATTSRAEEVAAPTADVQVLAQRQAAEERAVQSAAAARRARLERELATRREALAAGLSADLAALRERARSDAEQRVLELGRARAAVDTDRATAEQRLRERAEQDRRALDAFFADVLTALGPEGTTPTRTALDTAKKSLEARRSAELSALTAAHDAEAAALKARVEGAVTALAAEVTRIDREHAALEDALSASLSTTRTALAAELAAVLRQIDAETVAVKARHAQERLDLERVHRTQRLAVAGGSSAVRQATEDRHDREEAQLEAAQANERAAQAHAEATAKRDEETARKAAEEQRAADERDADAAHDLARSEAKARESAVATAGGAARSALEAAHGTRRSHVKATYDAAVSSVGDGHAGVRAAWARRLRAHEAELVDALAALERVTAVHRGDVEDAAAGRERSAGRGLQQAEAARERWHRQDLRRAEWTGKQERERADRDRERQLRLVRSEYFTLKIRAVAFGESPTSFTSVGTAFDPATDPGSLYGVAKRIGALDLPDHVTGEGVDVALLDTGVVDVPGLAEAEVEIGPDFSFEDVVPELRGRDTMGHGTHLAGIINARDEAWLAGDHERRPERVLGMAPGAGLVSVKAGAADGSVDVTQIIAAINWIIANKDTDGRNIRVLNLSFGTDGVQDPRVDPLAHAVERAWRAGIVVVVAGGNDGWAADRLTNPAQDPLVLAVGSSQALDGREDVPSTYSNGSAVGRTVDLSAPGRSVASLRSPGSRSDEANGGGRVLERLVRGSGTSQAAAVVSGAVALLLQARPELTPDQVKHVLMATAKEADGDDAGLAGAGYLRIDEALEAKVPWVRQQHEPSTGTGSLDGARGSVRVVRDGVVLEGEHDVFGRDWSGATWTEDSWTGAKWTGAKWTGAKWTGTSWSGAKWTSDTWTADVWDGATWTSQFWTGAKWTGAKWTADGFTGAKWTGAKWTSGGWFGHGWGDGPATTASTGAEPVSPEAEQVAAATP